MSHGFVPGDYVKVIDGTFIGRQGVVVSLAEARRLYQTVGGEQPPLKDAAGFVYVVIPVFDQEVPVCFLPFQLAVRQEQ